MMTLTWPTIKDVLLTTGRELSDDDVPSLAAAIAYYTVFSLPPLLVMIVYLAGALIGPDTVAEMITSQVDGVAGADGAATVKEMIENASSMGSGVGAKLAGIAALLFGASGAFGQLQKALNRAWEVEGQQGGGIRAVLAKRLLSFGMVVTIAFFLLVSLVVSGVLAAMGQAASDFAGEGAVGAGVQVLNAVVSLAVTSGLFAVLFKVLPDAEIAWRDVWVGALVTGVLFTLGKTAIGIYLGIADPASAFGAAGSLALLLVWIYYSALIVLIGAEFTQAWAETLGAGIDPEAPGEDSDEPRVTVGGADQEVHPSALPRDPAPY